jgi:hypothetical protein
MKKVLLGFLLISLIGLTGYAADKAGKTTINILFDNGITDKLSAAQVKGQNQIGDFMKEDMVRIFERYEKNGYEARLIDKESDYKAQAGSQLLKVKITNYNAGSKAARIMVGYGAGGVKLAIHYDLIADGKTIVSKDDDVYSGRDWRNAARKLNENTAKAIAGK